MKKHLLCAVCLLLITVFSACSLSAESAPTPVPPPSEPETVPPEEDTASGFSADQAFLYLEEEVYPLDAEALAYEIVNDADAALWVLAIPRLELLTAEGWQALRIEGVGFCGVPDQVSQKRPGTLPLEWYAEQLVAGHYRLSFQVVADDQDYSVVGQLSAEFDLE